MNVTETSAEGLKREFTITVPASEVEEQITRRLGEIGQSVQIRGFRPGRVPMPLLRQRFGSAVRGEVLESTVQDSSAEAIREHNLRPALPPRVEIVSAAEGGDLEYKISLELLPDMPEPDFAALQLEKLVADVPEEDVDRALAQLAESQRKTEPVERPAENGDVLVADVVGHADGAEIPGSRGEGREIELGGGNFLPGFTDQLIGVAAGETREVRVTFPEGYPDLAGKEGLFEIAVKEVRQRLPAALDDELAKAVGLETLAELRQEVRQRMQRDYDAVARQRLKQALLDKLAEGYEFPVPTGMVELEFQSIWAQHQAEKARRDGTADEGAGDTAEAALEAAPEAPAPEAPAPEAPADDAAPPAADDAAPAADSAEDEKAKAEIRQLAERRVRLGLLLAEVGRANNITVSQEELNQALAREARRHPGYERQVIDYYRKNPEAANGLRAPIFEEKVVDFIVELAKPGERTVTPQELMTGGAPQSEESAPA